MKIEFTGQSALDSDNVQANPSRLVNCYREIVQQGGKTGHVMKSVPGTTQFASMGGIFVRALDEIGGTLYAMSGGFLYKIMPDGTVTTLGAVTDGAEATISGNNGDVTAVIGGNYYRWNGTAVSEPTPGAFSEFGSVDYLGTYTMLTEKDGVGFQWSDVLAPQTLPGLNFSTADGRDDKNVRGLSIGGQYYIFKQQSHEIWYLTGDAGANAFDRVAGGVIDVGLKAHNLICKIPGGGAFYVGSDGKVRVVGIPSPVSSPPVETAIQGCQPEYCLAYEDEGHTFCAVVFRDCPAWVYDLSSGEWHERAQGATLGPWKASASAKLAETWYIARDGGDVLSLGRTNADGGIPLVREMTSLPLWNDGKRFTISELELFPRIGYAAGTLELSVSRDNGNIFGSPKPRSWAVGDYGKRITWRAMGQFRSAVVRVRMSDPIECPINTTGMVNG